MTTEQDISIPFINKIIDKDPKNSIKMLQILIKERSEEEDIIYILKNAKIDLNLLHLCIYKLLEEAIKAKMIELSFELTKYLDGNTSLMYYIKNNMKSEALEELERKKTDKKYYNKVNSDGDTALLLACRKFLFRF